MGGQVDGSKHEWLNKWLGEWLDGLTDEWMDPCMNVWINGWMGAWVDDNRNFFFARKCDCGWENEATEGTQFGG